MVTFSLSTLFFVADGYLPRERGCGAVQPCGLCLDASDASFGMPVGLCTEVELIDQPPGSAA